MSQNRWAIFLTELAIVGCLFAGILIGVSRTMNVSLIRVAAMIAVPTAASVLATWAARRNRPGILSIAAVVVGLYVFITGFSIGMAFVPSFAFLLWGALASFSSGPIKA